MLYMNQRDYRHIPYMHDLDHGGAPEERRNVATSGCGLCSMCMIVDHLTTKSLTLEECVRLSEENGANRKPGTSLRVLGPILAEMYDLEFSRTGSMEELVTHLQSGGEAVVNVNQKEDGTPGLFTTRSHWIVVVSTDGKEVCILDPNYAPGKFQEYEEQGLIRVKEPFLYCSLETLQQETRIQIPYYLFSRKK